jgi:hypothetical protein
MDRENVKNVGAQTLSKNKVYFIFHQKFSYDYRSAQCAGLSYSSFT